MFEQCGQNCALFNGKGVEVGSRTPGARLNLLAICSQEAGQHRRQGGAQRATVVRRDKPCQVENVLREERPIIQHLEDFLDRSAFEARRLCDLDDDAGRLFPSQRHPDPDARPDST